MWKSMPAVAAALLMCCGTYAACSAPLRWEYWGSFALLFLIFSLIWTIRSRNVRGREVLPGLSFCLLLFFSSATRVAVNAQLVPPKHIRNFLDTKKPLTLVCEIADEPRSTNGKTVTLVHVCSIVMDRDSLTSDGDALLTIVQNPQSGEDIRNFSYGSLISFQGTLNAPIVARNPGEFSYRDYLALNNIYATIHIRGYDNVSILAAGNPNLFFRYVIFPSKHFVVEVVRASMSGDESNFLIGLLLGDRTDMSAEIKNAFINTGTIHVLAVSGSHVVLVVAIIYTLFGLIRLTERWKIAATIFGILYYMVLTGSTASVVRASLMAIVVLLARLFQQRTNVYNSLGASAVLLLAYDPLQMFDAGFQLSYSAVFSMAYFYPKLAALIKSIPESLEEIKAIDYVLKLFAVSLSAQIGTIPFTAYFFGRVSIISLLANLVVVPLVEIIVTIGFVAVLARVFSLWISICFSEVNHLLTWFTLKFVLLANAVPHATISTPTFGIKETFFYSVSIAALFNFTKRKVLKGVLAVGLGGIDLVLVLSILSSHGAQLKKMRVEFIDVGQGDAALIELPSGQHVVVDAGPKTFAYDAGEKVVAPFLRRRGIESIDVLIVSHPHSDHLGGVPFLLRTFNVREVIDGGQPDQTALYREYTSLVTNIRRDVAAGTRIDVSPNVRLYTLHPTAAFLDLDSTDGYDHLNNSSVVLKLQYGHTSFLLVGDAEIPVEEQLDSVYGSFLKSDVLKAGHHGSSTSSSVDFLAFVAPKEVVVSVGKFNKFHHPSQKVISRFMRLGAHVHRTDEEGGVIFESDGDSLVHVNWRKE